MTGSDRTLATTWATSVARLTPESRRLLDRLAFLAPDPVPDLLLDVAVPGEASDTDAYEARADLYAYSLISAVTAEDGGAPGFVVHRLVQDFARRAMSEERRAQALREALDGSTPRSSAIHRTCGTGQSSIRSLACTRGRALCGRGGDRGADSSAVQSAWCDAQGEGRLRQAERSMRRALAIDEKSYGPDHPNVAIDLNNLASCFMIRTDSPRPSR